MPVPAEIAQGPYLLVGDYDITLRPAGRGDRAAKLDRNFHADGFGFTKLRALIDFLRSTYAGKMGAQYMHIATELEQHAKE